MFLNCINGKLPFVISKKILAIIVYTIILLYSIFVKIHFNIYTFIAIVSFPSLLALAHTTFTNTVSGTVSHSTIRFRYITLSTFPTFFTMTKASTILPVVRTQHWTNTFNRIEMVNKFYLYDSLTIYI